jgi:ribose transport system permease protein
MSADTNQQPPILAADALPAAANPSLFKRLLQMRELPIILSIIALAAFISWRNPAFLSLYNMQLLAREVGVLGMMAIAVMVVIITGGIDLSVGSVVALVSVLTAMGLAAALPVWLVVPGVLLICVLIGLTHTLLVHNIGLAPFIATLGTLSVLRGVSLIITQGYPIRIETPALLWLGQGDIAGIPIQFVALLLIFALYSFVLFSTPLGRYIYALGSNPVATRLSGVAVPLIMAIVYVQASVVFGVSGLMYAGRLGQGMPGIGAGMELPVIASAIIGGTSLSGGVGKPLGAILGAVLISLILNAMNMLAISSYWQELVTGLVIVAAVGVDILNRRRASVR